MRMCIVQSIAAAACAAAAWWPTLAAHGYNLEFSLKGAGLVLAAGSCSVLGLFAIRADWLKQRNHLLEQTQACVLAEPGVTAPPPADPQAAAAAGKMREQVEQMRSRISQLQVQRKSVEIQLRLADAERRQTETMINGMADAVLVTNNFDELIVVNPAAAEIFQIDIPASARKPVSQFVEHPRLLADIAEMRQNPSRGNRRNLEVTLPVEGRQRTFSVNMNCVLDSSNQLSGVVTVLHDNTREKEISKMKSEFVSHVSHELRTPLSSIKAYAELLVDGEAADDTTRNEFYHIIQGEADRLSRLIDNILNISRIESGMTRINKKPISVTGILKEVLEVAMPSAREKNITLVDQILPLFCQIEADRDMIYQAALNLVGNAIKYTPAGGTVRVSASADESQGVVIVNVIDTGVGIPPEAMANLFEKFYRVEQHKNMAKGSGLGLHLTQQIIETIHKGKMHVVSEPGKGSSFGFSLPILA